MSDLTNEIPYQKYADEAYSRKGVVGINKAVAESKTRGLVGKAGAVGDNLKFIGGSTQKDLKAGDEAYDARQNQRESEMEDMQKRFELNSALAKKK